MWRKYIGFSTFLMKKILWKLSLIQKHIYHRKSSKTFFYKKKLFRLSFRCTSCMKDAIHPQAHLLWETPLLQRHLLWKTPSNQNYLWYEKYHFFYETPLSQMHFQISYSYEKFSMESSLIQRHIYYRKHMCKTISATMTLFYEIQLRFRRTFTT